MSKWSRITKYIYSLRSKSTKCSRPVKQCLNTVLPLARRKLLTAFRFALEPLLPLGRS